MRIGKSVLAASVLAALAMTGTSGASVIFSDTFANGSSLNPASYPTVTANSTGYDVASTKNASSGIASGSLSISMGATTSGVVQGQALFAASPTTLAPNQFIEYTLVFTNSAAGNLLAGGNASAVYAGLYNSAASAPVSGLQTSGLNATAGSSFATGGTQLWQGYDGRVVGTGGNNQIYTRPQQNGGANTTSAHQDLVGNNAGGGLYNDPAGATVGSNAASTAVLAASTQYTMDLKITLNPDGSEKIDSALYTGVGTGGAVVATQSSTTSTTPLTTSFDGLSFGLRQSGTSVATQMIVNSITVQTDFATAPEPTLLALPCLLAGAIRRRRTA